MKKLLHTERNQTKCKTGKMEISQKGKYESSSLVCKNMSNSIG